MIKVFRIFTFIFIMVFSACGDDAEIEPTFIPRSAQNEEACVGCVLNGECQEGIIAAACGGGGIECVACEGGEICDAFQQCAAPAECTSENCEGCCDSDNICHEGTELTFCGKGAEICKVCQENWTCEASSCKAPPELCGAGNCEGCCDAEGQCKLENTALLCGKMGNVCVLCEEGDLCSNIGECSAAPTCADTCEGCCVGETCISPTTTMQCGIMGNACMDCGTQSCILGICQTSEIYNFEIMSTIVASSKPDGSPWDVLDSIPELYIIAGSVDVNDPDKVYGAISGEIPGLVTTWNTVLETKMPISSLQNYFSIIMKESDTFSDNDLVCAMRGITVDANMLTGNEITTVCAADSRTSITWRLIPQ